MNISVFGLGYVGCVSSGCLALLGHKIIGVDINEHKVALINQGKSTIIEKDIDNIIDEQHQRGTITATDDYYKAVKETEISFICVGTPSLETGHLKLDFVFNTAQQIGEGLKEKINSISLQSEVQFCQEQISRLLRSLRSFPGKKIMKILQLFLILSFLERALLLKIILTLL